MAMDLLIIMTKYTLILAPLEVFSKRTFLGQGPETAALPDPEQMKIKASSIKLQATSCDAGTHRHVKLNMHM
jgi:hypothetical protein